MQEGVMVENIHWLGHDCFRVEGTHTVYFDPWKLAPDAPPADIVLVTHDHHDHFDMDDIRKIAGPGTVIVGPKVVTDQVSGFETLTVAPGDTVEVKSAKVTAVPAYNLTKFRSPGVPYHPKEAGYVGYILDMDGRTIYHAGDTDEIPEMRGIEVNVALLPVSGIYCMSGGEAAEACTVIKADVAIPMHYGFDIGSEDDAQRMRRLCKIPVRVVEKEER
jgi:L-ascorbate metabolism protein UlaG (beta-lactamase superfamily)